MTFDHEIETACFERWAETGVSSRSASRLAELDEIIFCLNAVSRAIEADEQATRAADEDNLDYVTLPVQTRKGLRLTRQVLQSRLERTLDLLHKALVKDGASS